MYQNEIIVDNNFMIPQLWRIFRENHLHSKIVLPMQMQEEVSKWKFELDLASMEFVEPKKRTLTENIFKNINPLDFIEKYPYIMRFNYQKYSIAKCLDWLTNNLEDDQWLLDDFRGEKSSLMDSRYATGYATQTYWANPTVAILFSKQEDMNLLKVLKEDFKDAN